MMYFATLALLHKSQFISQSGLIRAYCNSIFMFSHHYIRAGGFFFNLFFNRQRHTVLKNTCDHDLNKRNKKKESLLVCQNKLRDLERCYCYDSFVWELLRYWDWTARKQIRNKVSSFIFLGWNNSIHICQCFPWNCRWVITKFAVSQNCQQKLFAEQNCNIAWTFAIIINFLFKPNFMSC